MTPPLPDWITQHQLAGYDNAHRLMPNEPRLYGTESLYGDWNGHALLLAKDFAPSSLIHQRWDASDPRPYHHEPSGTRRPGSKTNTNLERMIKAHGLCRASTPQRCGLLYGSALANMLRGDGETSGRLPNESEGLAYGARVLKFVLAHMPHLRVLVCMGSDAWQCAQEALGAGVIAGEHAERRDRKQPIPVNGIGIHVVAAYHPAARVGQDKMAGAWALASRLLQD